MNSNFRPLRPCKKPLDAFDDLDAFLGERLTEAQLADAVPLVEELEISLRTAEVREATLKSRAERAEAELEQRDAWDAIFGAALQAAKAEWRRTLEAGEEDAPSPDELGMRTSQVI